MVRTLGVNRMPKVGQLLYRLVQQVVVVVNAICAYGAESI